MLQAEDGPGGHRGMADDRGDAGAEQRDQPCFGARLPSGWPDDRVATQANARSE